MKHLRQRDIEKLSAYLDQELSPKEMKKFEFRLHSDPTLRAALLEFEKTKKLLVGLPRVSPPHNFTLTRAMAGEIKGRGFYPFFRVASLIATVAFAVLVGADAFLIDQVGESRFAAPLAASELPEDLAMDAQLLDESASEELITKADVVAEQPAELANEDPDDQVLPTPTSSRFFDGDPAFGANTEQIELTQTACRECPIEGESDVSIPTGAAAERSAIISTGTAADSGVTIPTAQPTLPASTPPPTADLELAEDASVQSPTTTDVTEPEDRNLLLRIAEVASAFAALLFAAAAFILRRTL